MARRQSRQPDQLTRRTMMTSAAAAIGGAVVGGRSGVTAQISEVMAVYEEYRRDRVDLT